MTHRLVALVLEVSDLGASAHFYHDLIGVPLEPGDNNMGDDRWIGGRHWEYSWRDGAYLHFALFKAHGAPTTHSQVGFVVDDLAATHARITQAKVKVVHPPRPEPWGETARYEDPDGNVVSLT